MAIQSASISLGVKSSKKDSETSCNTNIQSWEHCVGRNEETGSKSMD